MAGVGAPLREPIIDRKTGRLTPVWERYFTLTIVPAINTIVNGNIESIPTLFEDGSVPFVEDGFLKEDNTNFTWDNINDVLNVLAIKILGLTPDSVLYIDDDNFISEDTPSFTWDDVTKILSALKIATDKISFNLIAGLTPDEGELTWDGDDGTLSLGMPGGNVKLQIGLESLARVINKSGATIENGKLVYVSGSQGSRDTIELSDKTDVDTIFILGMATEDIGDNQNGYVARFGYVRGSVTEPIDTSGTVAGDPVYLGTAGNFTVTHPTNPTEAVVIIGNVNRVHATEGVISLQPPKAFTIGNDFDGTMRQSVINKSTGNAAGSSFTVVNDEGHRASLSIFGNSHATLPNIAGMYNEGYGDTYNVMDGNKDFVWVTDPTDSHDFSSLTNEVMRLIAAGHLKLVKDNSKMMWGEGDDSSIYYDGVDLNIKTNEVAASDLKIDCGTDKTLELQDTVWDDYVTPLGPNNWAGVSNNPTLTKLFDDGAGSQGVYGFVFSDGDEAIITIQIPHKYKEGTTIEPHIHFIALTDVDPSENFGIEFEYTWTNIGDDFPANTVLSTIDIPTGVNTVNMQQVADVVGSGIDGTGKNISSVLMCRIKRVAATVDNYAGGVVILDFDIHYEINTLGSRQENIK